MREWARCVGSLDVLRGTEEAWVSVGQRRFETWEEARISVAQRRSKAWQEVRIWVTRRGSEAPSARNEERIARVR
jgi:hypothetical protein